MKTVYLNTETENKSLGTLKFLGFSECEEVRCLPDDLVI